MYIRVKKKKKVTPRTAVSELSLHSCGALPPEKTPEAHKEDPIYFSLYLQKEEGESNHCEIYLSLLHNKHLVFWRRKLWQFRY